MVGGETEEAAGVGRDVVMTGTETASMAVTENDNAAGALTTND